MSEPLIESETEFLRRENAELRAESERLRAAIQSAQTKLRATQNNWHEDCLFDCDEILTAALEREP